MVEPSAILEYLKHKRELRGDTEKSVYEELGKIFSISLDEVKEIIESLRKDGLITKGRFSNYSSHTKERSSGFVIYAKYSPEESKKPKSANNVYTQNHVYKKRIRLPKSLMVRRDRPKRTPVKTALVSEDRASCPFLRIPDCLLKRNFDLEKDYRIQYCLGNWTKYELCRFYRDEIQLRGATLMKKRRQQYYSSMGFNLASTTRKK